MNWHGVKAKRKGERTMPLDPVECDGPAEPGSDDLCQCNAVVRVVVNGQAQHLCVRHFEAMRSYFEGEGYMPETEAI